MITRVEQNCVLYSCETPNDGVRWSVSQASWSPALPVRGQLKAGPVPYAVWGLRGETGGGGSRSAHCCMGIFTDKNWMAHKAVTRSPSIPLLLGEDTFGKLEWKWMHNGHLTLKSCGNNIGPALPSMPVCVHMCVCMFMNDSCCNTKAHAGFTQFDNHFSLEGLKLFISCLIASLHQNTVWWTREIITCHSCVCGFSSCLFCCC